MKFNDPILVEKYSHFEATFSLKIHALEPMTGRRSQISSFFFQQKIQNKSIGELQMLSIENIAAC